MDDQPPVVAFAELVQLLGLSRARVVALTKKAAFPAPIAYLRVGKIWRYSDVADFCAATGRAVHPIPPPDEAP